MHAHAHTHARTQHAYSYTQTYTYPLTIQGRNIQCFIRWSSITGYSTCWWYYSREKLSFISNCEFICPVEYGPDHMKCCQTYLLGGDSPCWLVCLIVGVPRCLGLVLEKFGIYGKTHFHLQQICMCVHVFGFVSTPTCLCAVCDYILYLYGNFSCSTVWPSHIPRLSMPTPLCFGLHDFLVRNTWCFIIWW